MFFYLCLLTSPRKSSVLYLEYAGPGTLFQDTLNYGKM